jgi:ADP-ribosylglycohydrolase
MACIAGSLAEAYYGIPEDLVERTKQYLPEDMLTVVNQFYDKLGV